MPRDYDNSKRARGAAETFERIAQVTEALAGAVPLSEITLQAIARGAGVTVQTVLRHAGSRDGCFEAVTARVVARIDAHRGRSAPGDVDGAIDGLIEHYESDGRLVLNLLSQETSDDPIARQAIETGRAYHRAWVQRCFCPETPLATDALVAATDLYVWKLLRLDLGRSASATRAVITRLIRATMESS